MSAQLLSRVTADNANDHALTERQALALQEGVKAAIETGANVRLGLPSNRLTASQWTHAGIGVSVYVHKPSGVMILQKQEHEPIIADVDVLDNVSTATAKFHADTGGIERINNEMPDSEREA